MKKIRWCLDHFEEGFLLLSLGMITVVMFAQVVSRYVFQASLVWTEELSRYFFILMAFAGLSYGIRTKSHLRIDLLETAVPILKLPFEIITDILVVGFCVFMLRPALNSVQFIFNSGQVSPAMEIPMFVVYIPLAVGLVLSIIRMVEKYIKRAMGIETITEVSIEEVE